MNEKKDTKEEVAQGRETKSTQASIEQNIKQIAGIIEEALVAKSRDLSRIPGHPTVYIAHIGQIVIYPGSLSDVPRDESKP